MKKNRHEPLSFFERHGKGCHFHQQRKVEAAAPFNSTTFQAPSEKKNVAKKVCRVAGNDRSFLSKYSVSARLASHLFSESGDSSVDDVGKPKNAKHIPTIWDGFYHDHVVIWGIVDSWILLNPVLGMMPAQISVAKRRKEAPISNIDQVIPCLSMTQSSWGQQSLVPIWPPMIWRSKNSQRLNKQKKRIRLKKEHGV